MKTLTAADKSIALLNKVLDLRAEKEKVIASNIANSETPGYAPAKFEFEDALKSAVQQGNFSLKMTHHTHIPITPTEVGSVQGRTVVSETPTIGDQNGVSLEQEMIALSENELLYETAAQLLKKKLGIRKYVISGGQ